MGIKDEINKWMEDSKQRVENAEKELKQEDEPTDPEVEQEVVSEDVEENTENEFVDTTTGEILDEEPELLQEEVAEQPVVIKKQKKKQVSIEDDGNGNKPPNDLLVTEPQSPIINGEIDVEAFKSELVKQGFDIPPEKILHRTRLPKRSIVPLAVCATVDEIGDTTRKKSLMMRYMENYGFFQLSEGGKVRMEIMTSLASKEENFEPMDTLHR